jgi:hypothetical protein
MNKLKIKLFFWSFGLIFIFITYYLLFYVPVFSYLIESIYIPYLILLILLVLFFLIGNYSSKIPLFWYNLFWKKDLKGVLKEIEIRRKEEEVDELVKKLKQSINILSKNKYSNISIKYLIDNIGVSEESASKIILNIKRLKRLKTLSVFLGLFLAIILYFSVTNLSLFSHIPQYIFLISAIIIFLLFVLEGYLVTRMPDSFYLDLINVNKKKLLEYQKEMIFKSNYLNNLNAKQKESLENIKNAIKFLLNQNISKDSIVSFFNKYDISKETINQLIVISKNEIDKDANNSELSSKSKKNDFKSDAMIKLTLSKIHDSFEQINNIYTQVTKLQKEVLDISERQKRLEKIALSKSINSNKNINSQNNLKTNTFTNQKQNSIIRNEFQNKEIQNKEIKSIKDISFDLKKINSKKLKELLNKKDSEYQKLISYLYHLFLPYKDDISQNDVFSTLLYHNYPYEVVEDVLQKFKDKKVIFAKDNKYSISEKIVNKINSFYEIFSK